MEDLSSEQVEIVRRAMFAAADGPFFPDWEFETLMGVSREEVRRVAREWPRQDGDPTQNDIAANALNNLLGYPHGKEREMESAVGSTAAELNALLSLL